jgi:hypothetical protein
MEQYLTHYWSFDNEQMLDQTGIAHMTQGNLTTFVEDRFGNPKSALALNGGWTQVPPGVYFDTPEFSVSVWVYPMNIGPFSRVIDFGNGERVDNLVLSLSESISLEPYLDVFPDTFSTLALRAKSFQQLKLHEWQFLVVTFNETNACIYMNGTLTANLIQNFSLSPKPRTNCYIGKSNWASDEMSESYLDDLKFYNKSLTQEDILDLMNENRTSRRTFFHF